MDLIAFFMNLSNSNNKNREGLILDLRENGLASCRKKDPEHQDNMGNSKSNGLSSCGSWKTFRRSRFLL
jgi:hypothetical protein